MVHWIWIPISLIIGAIVGCLCIALVSANKRANECLYCKYKTYFH